MKPEIILASASPRRRILLACAVRTFMCESADIDETAHQAESPQEYCRRLGIEKATAVALRHADQDLIIASDTTIFFENEIIGKAENEAHAKEILLKLCGREHTVFTSIALISGGKTAALVDEATIKIRTFTDSEMNSYIKSGKAFGKAGAYGIQDADFLPVENFSGCYAAIMGLPLCLLARKIQEFGFETNSGLRTHCKDATGHTCIYQPF